MANITSPMPGLSVFEQTKDVLQVYYSYLSLGILAFVVNLIIIVVYISNHSLRTRFTMYAGLAIADMINGLGFAITGLERIQLEYSLINAYSYPIMSRHQCAVQIGNILQVIGSQWPALITLALGLERFFAIRYPIQYRHFKIKMFHGLLITSFLISLISISVALYIGTVIQRYSRAFFICSLSNAYGYEYSTFNYFLTMICHLVGFFLNIVAFKMIRQTAQRVGSYNRNLSKEMKKVKINFFVSLLSLIMVVIPNFFLYISRFIDGGFSYLLLGWVYCFFVLRSAFNLWVIGFGVTEFKITFFERFVPCASPSGTLPSLDDSKTGIAGQNHTSQNKHSVPRTIKVATIS